jgi:hypothetical protein
VVERISQFFVSSTRQVSRSAFSAAQCRALQPRLSTSFKSTYRCSERLRVVIVSDPQTTHCMANSIRAYVHSHAENTTNDTSQIHIHTHLHMHAHRHEGKPKAHAHMHSFTHKSITPYTKTQKHKLDAYTHTLSLSFNTSHKHTLHSLHTLPSHSSSTHSLHTRFTSPHPHQLQPTSQSTRNWITGRAPFFTAMASGVFPYVSRALAPEMGTAL